MGRRRSVPLVLAEAGDLSVLRDPERASGRLLRQAGMDASYVDLADPRHLEFDYMRWMAAVVEALGARDILHVGAAAGALARALATSHVERRQELVEVDPDVVELARAHLGLRRAAGLKVRVADGREAIARRRDESTDAVLVDAFVGARVPSHLVSTEALADIARILRPDGVVAVNVVDARGLPDTRLIASGLSESFAVIVALGAAPVVHGRRSGNVVLVAGRGQLPLETIRARVAADRSPALLAACLRRRRGAC